MSCCGEKYKRQKDLQLMTILAERYAVTTGEHTALIEMKHGVYGIYYEFVPKRETEDIKSKYYGAKILQEFGRDTVKSVSKSVGKRTAKVS